MSRKDLAIAAFERLGLTGRNRRLAVYWLSLWEGDRLPERARLQPSALRELLPGIGLFSVKPGISTYCRLAGTELTRAIGLDLTGLSWQHYTPPAEWKSRLERNSVIATGSVGIGVRFGVDANGELQKAVELQLPFDDVGEDGTRQLLFHLDWRPPEKDVRRVPPEGPHIADQFFSVPLI